MKAIENWEFECPESELEPVNFTSGSDDFGDGFLSLSFGRIDPIEGSDPISILPPAFGSRLYDIFNQIEREFEALYYENLLCKYI